MELARLEAESVDSFVVVRVHGEIDASNADSVGEEIGSMSDGSPAGLVVDLASTSYLDSAGIRMLLRLRSRLEQERREVCVAVPAGSPVRQVLGITEIPQVIRVVETRDEAVRALQEG